MTIYFGIICSLNGRPADQKTVKNKTERKTSVKTGKAVRTKSLVRNKTRFHERRLLSARARRRATVLLLLIELNVNCNL